MLFNHISKLIRLLYIIHTQVFLTKMSPCYIREQHSEPNFLQFILDCGEDTTLTLISWTILWHIKDFPCKGGGRLSGLRV